MVLCCVALLSYMAVLIWQHARTMANVISRMLNCIEFSHSKQNFRSQNLFLGGWVLQAVVTS